jgi:hypothetical protein
MYLSGYKILQDLTERQGSPAKISEIRAGTYYEWTHGAVSGFYVFGAKQFGGWTMKDSCNHPLDQRKGLSSWQLPGGGTAVEVICLVCGLCRHESRSPSGGTMTSVWFKPKKSKQ